MENVNDDEGSRSSGCLQQAAVGAEEGDKMHRSSSIRRREEGLEEAVMMNAATR